MIIKKLIMNCSSILLVIISSCADKADAARHYRIHQDEKSLYKTLYRNIREGDTKVKVESLLGKGKEFSTLFEGQPHDVWVEEARRVISEKFGIGDPKYDEIIYWPISDNDTSIKSFVSLCFRNEVLVYFRHDDYKKTPDGFFEKLPQERIDELLEELPDSIKSNK